MRYNAYGAGYSAYHAHMRSSTARAALATRASRKHLAAIIMSRSIDAQRRRRRGMAA